MGEITEPEDAAASALPAAPRARPGGTTGPTGPTGFGVVTGSARLHPDRTAARRARSLMTEWLVSWWGPEAADPPGRAQLRDRLALVLSELVSNAVVHGPTGGTGGERTLEIELHEFDGTVRLVVADRSRGPGDPAFRPPAAPSLPGDEAMNGRGLFIVDQLADIWQAEPTSDGLVVWCDFGVDATDPGQPPSSPSSARP